MQKKVVKCLELIQDLTVISEGSTTNAAAAAATTTNEGSGMVVASLPHSPNGVLEAVACLSYKSDERTKPTVGSCPTHTTSSSPETKRKKLDTRTFQKS